jgi:hypothetical protein
MYNLYPILCTSLENRRSLSPFVNQGFGKVAGIVERVAWEDVLENWPQKEVDSLASFPRHSPQNMFMKIGRISLKKSPFPQIHVPYY